MKKQPLLLALLLTPLFLFAEVAKTPTKSQPITPLSTIDAQLAQAQKDFEIAKGMFNPWYAGPLLTPGAHNVPPGFFNFQGYVFAQDTYARFDKNGSSKSIPTLWTVQPVAIFQAGLTSWLDFTLIGQAFYNHQSGQSATNIGDTSVQLGVQLIPESAYRPAVRLVIAESFPTGKYQKLNPKKLGLDSTGSGSYKTTISLNSSKVVWWFLLHPMNFRLSLNYTIPSMVHVERFNSYGGGYRTEGKVHPGNNFSVDGAIEFSFTQHWVLALDVVYSYTNVSTFSGRKGTTSTGATAVVGAPSSSQLSIAPAIEYNPSEHLGIIAGVWATLAGRNSANFVSGVVSVTVFW
jgi:hypothetical protein